MAPTMSRRSLRWALAGLSIGFALEGFGTFLRIFRPSYLTPLGGGLFVLPLLLPLLGFLLLRGARTGMAHADPGPARVAAAIFGASIFAGGIAAAVPIALVADPSVGQPTWSPLLFGSAAAGLLLGIMATYVYLLYYLVSRVGQLVLTIALAWAAVIAVAVGEILAGSLGSVITALSRPSLQLPAVVAPVEDLLSYLFVSFFLLFAISIEAHVAVAQGRFAPDPRWGARNRASG